MLELDSSTHRQQVSARDDLQRTVMYLCLSNGAAVDLDLVVACGILFVYGSRLVLREPDPFDTYDILTHMAANEGGIATEIPSIL